MIRIRDDRRVRKSRLEKKSPAVLGIDLAGVPHRPTGICLLEDGRARTTLLYKDSEILH